MSDVRKSCKAHVLFVGQKVKDIKLPYFPELAEVFGRLRAWLHQYSFIPGDKVTAVLTPVGISDDGVVTVHLGGKTLSADSAITPFVELGLPVKLMGYTGPMAVEALFRAVSGAQVDDGGNVQNMSVNLAYLASGLAADYPGRFGPNEFAITVTSSSDPFECLDRDLASRFRKFVTYYPLGIEDRYAIQGPWEHESDSGTLSITSEPVPTGEALERLITSAGDFGKAFSTLSCVVSADPIFEQLSRFATPPYATVINSSTAFRALVAVTSYGKSVLLPQNCGEAADVCKLLLSRAQSLELSDATRPPFETPFTTTGEEIDHESLRTLDESVDLFSRYCPWYRRITGQSFVSPISFGQKGGLVVGYGENSIACFTSVPSESGERLILDEYGNPDADDLVTTFDVGAGDAVATIVALFNTISPNFLIAPHLKGEEVRNGILRELASAIFVSAMGRIVGFLQVRTEKTYLASLRLNCVSRIMNDLAERSLELARSTVKKLHTPAIGRVKDFDIRVIVWRPGQVAHPEGFLSP